MAAAAGVACAREVKRTGLRFMRLSLLGGLLATLAACAGTVPTVDGQRSTAQRPTWDQVSPDFRHLAGWIDDDHAQAVPAVQRTCTETGSPQST